MRMKYHMGKSKKDKISPVHAVKALRRNGDIAPCILYFSTRWTWVDNLQAPGKEPSVRI